MTEILYPELPKDLKLIADKITQGKIFAYPTESVFGIGCDALNNHSIEKVINFKGRDYSKGLIVISDDTEKLKSFIEKKYYELFCSKVRREKKPTTWIVPPESNISPLIKGDSSKVAIRVTSHMVCKKLCQYSNSALISTSANISGQEPLKIFNKVKKEFNGKIDFIVNGVVGGYNKPTQIIDLLTEDVIRKS